MLIIKSRKVWLELKIRFKVTIGLRENKLNKLVFYRVNFLIILPLLYIIARIQLKSLRHLRCHSFKSLSCTTTSNNSNKKLTFSSQMRKNRVKKETSKNQRLSWPKSKNIDWRRRSSREFLKAASIMDKDSKIQNNKLNRNKKRWIRIKVQQINLTVKWEFAKFVELCRALQIMITDYKCISKVNYIKAISQSVTSSKSWRIKETRIEEEELIANTEVIDLVLDQWIGQEETKKLNLKKKPKCTSTTVPPDMVLTQTCQNLDQSMIRLESSWALWLANATTRISMSYQTCKVFWHSVRSGNTTKGI